MYTLDSIYNRLDTGATGAQSVFTEPAAGPTAGTGRSLNEIMAKVPAVNSSAATTTEVLSGKTFWGLSLGAWGLQTGSMANVGAQNITPGVSAQTITQGYHDGTGSVAGDADLITGNIRAGQNIFGVEGDSNVVDTSSADAVQTDIATGKKAWVDGSEITGTGVLATGAATDADVLSGVTYSNAAGASVGTRPAAPVAKTGLTASYATGDDGNLQKGVAWPSPRFTDNADGTVTDNLTSLVWLKNANVWGMINWATALTNCNSLADGTGGLTDGSVAGDWRLPNILELQSLMDYGQFNPALPAGHPFTGVQSSYYWSGTTYANGAAIAWYVHLGIGYVDFDIKTRTYYVWPVRSGQ
jgi:hypothetical protein